MNWFKLTKLSQIWESDNIEDDFEGSLYRLYEFEYKLSMLKNRPFSGMEKRQQNIMSKLEESLEYELSEIKTTLIGSFHNWLEFHAILTPQTWANKRVELNEEIYGGGMGYEETMVYKESLQSIIDEYMRYKKGGPNERWYNAYQSPNWESAFSTMLAEALQNIDKFPTLQRMHNIFLQGEKEYLENELYDMGFEEFGRNYGQEFTNEVEAENFIENYEIDLSDLMHNYGTEEFMNMANQHINVSGFFIELYQNLVFPLWFDHWKSQGIEGTRENVEEVYKKLQTQGDINQEIVNVQLALNTTHQTGDMIEYIESDTGSSNLADLFSDLSNGKYISEWNEQLKAIGIQI